MPHLVVGITYVNIYDQNCKIVNIRLVMSLGYGLGFSIKDNNSLSM